MMRRLEMKIVFLMFVNYADGRSVIVQVMMNLQKKSANWQIRKNKLNKQLSQLHL